MPNLCDISFQLYFDVKLQIFKMIMLRIFNKSTQKQLEFGVFSRTHTWPSPFLKSSVSLMSQLLSKGSNNRKKVANFYPGLSPFFYMAILTF